MVKTDRVSLLPLLMLVLPWLLFYGCSNDLEGQNQGSGGKGAQAGGRAPGSLGAGQGRAPEAVPVEVGLPWRADLSSYVFGNTHIEALREVEIIARVQGQLERLAVEEGTRVNKGQVLAELNKTELELALREAAARLENNRAVYERTKKMLEQELTSQETLDNNKYLFETAKTQYEQAELNLQYTTITAPFSGIITQRLIEQGDMVRVNTVLFQLADMGKLLARVYVPEKELARVKVGDRVRLESEMFPGETFEGVVEMISPVVDPATGTVKVTVAVAGNSGRLKPGMFCSAYILTDTHKNSLVISRKALIPDVDETEVYVVGEGGMARRRNVSIGIEQGDTLEVLAGLEDGEQVVIVGKETLRDGSTVKIITDEPAGAEPVPSTQRAGPREGTSRGPGTR
ncbi:MAG: efflux RND transporter periplasmic adaptor subunit [Candidatus Glassbacteria bacterium]|nr:efflux RND transporter periplasmic adaptor subunit [Candidatus Glassbacteria bacterium]